jgi:phage tail protein X
MDEHCRAVADRLRWEVRLITAQNRDALAARHYVATTAAVVPQPRPALAAADPAIAAAGPPIAAADPPTAAAPDPTIAAHDQAGPPAARPVPDDDTEENS